MSLYTPVTLQFEKELCDWVLEDLERMKATTHAIVKGQFRAKHDFPDELIDKVNKELNSYGMPNVAWADSYVRRKGSKQYLHIDGQRFPLFCAINFPLKGTKNSRFEYYGGDYTITQHEGLDNLYWFNTTWTGEPKLIDNLELTKSHLVRVNVPHMAVASAEEDRWILSMRFEGNPTYEYMQECIAKHNL